MQNARTVLAAALPRQRVARGQELQAVHHDHLLVGWFRGGVRDPSPYVYIYI